MRRFFPQRFLIIPTSKHIQVRWKSCRQNIQKEKSTAHFKYHQDIRTFFFTTEGHQNIKFSAVANVCKNPKHFLFDFLKVQNSSSLVIDNQK